MAKRFQRQSSSFTQFVQQAFNPSGDLLRPESFHRPLNYFFKSLISSESMFTGAFQMLDSGRERQPPATATPLLKLSSQLSQTDEQPEGTDTGERRGRGTCYWRPACPMRMQHRAGGRSRWNKNKIRPIAERHRLEEGTGDAHRL